MCLSFLSDYLEQSWVYSQQSTTDSLDEVVGRNIRVSTSDGEVIDCALLWDESFKKTAVLFHGNGGNLSTRGNLLNLMHVRLGMNLLCFDYRGFGRSTGIPCENGIMKDVDAVMEMLLSNRDTKPPYLFIGRSLGGAVAIRAAVKYPEHVSCLILENTFRSVASAAPPTVKLFASFFLRECWVSEKHIRDVRTNTLIIAGVNDTMISPSDSMVLYENCGAPEKRIGTINADHSNGPGKAEYWSLIKNFL